MGHFRALRAAALLSTGLAAFSLAACNNSASAQNGAYVDTSTDSSSPASNQPLPPSSEYQAVADNPPPPLPVYDQPPIPGPGYVWTPGYWGWSDDSDDYYWVPGTWVEPPSYGDLWTPGYWRFYNGRYLYSDGYWGPQVGFYGGVDYGYGYGGSGYNGGRWQGNQFYYNSQANNLGGRQFGATYSEGLSSNGNRASFNGGPGGLRVTPAQADITAAHARAAPPTSSQREQARAASAQPQFRASVNRGSPPVAATSRPGAFGSESGVTAARSAATYAPPANHGVAPQAAPQPTSRPLGREDVPASRPVASALPNERVGRAAPVGPSPMSHQAAAPMRAAAPERAPQMHAQTAPRAAPVVRAPVVRAPQVRAAAPPPRATAPATGPRPEHEH
jgi:hypothetical protein